MGERELALDGVGLLFGGRVRGGRVGPRVVAGAEVAKGFALNGGRAGIFEVCHGCASLLCQPIHRESELSARGEARSVASDFLEPDSRARA